MELVGSPLTHERFLRRHRGTYGPELSAADSAFPGARTAVDGLLTCGDSCWPGIGVPAVAGSGIAAAHAVTGAGAQRELLREIRDARAGHAAAGVSARRVGTRRIIRDTSDHVRDPSEMC